MITIQENLIFLKFFNNSAMNKILILIILCVMCLWLFSCEKIKGDGEFRDDVRFTAPFTGVSLSLDCIVTLDTVKVKPGTGSGNSGGTGDSLYSVKISAQDGLFEFIETSVSGGVLSIRFSEKKILTDHDPIRITVTAPEFNSLALYTPGTIIMDTPGIQYHPFLECNNTGSGTINLQNIRYSYVKIHNSGSGYVFCGGLGFMKKCNVESSGSGQIDLFKATADSIWAISGGSGNISVSVNSYLNGTISASGNIYYQTDTATIISNDTGSGSMIPL